MPEVQRTYLGQQRGMKLTAEISSFRDAGSSGPGIQTAYCLVSGSGSRLRRAE